MKLYNTIFLFFIALILFTSGNYVYISSTTNEQIITKIAQLPAFKYALVLGTGKNQPFAPENFTFTGRMKTTLRLYKQHEPLERIIVSGLNNKHNYNEPHEMKMHLIKNGMDSKIIEIDEAGSRTFNSILQARTKYKFDPIIIVSQKEHLQRALFIANALGMNCVGLEANAVPKKNSVKLIGRELLARLKCNFDIIKFKLTN